MYKLAVEQLKRELIAVEEKKAIVQSRQKTMVRRAETKTEA